MYRHTYGKYRPTFVDVDEETVSGDVVPAGEVSPPELIMRADGKKSRLQGDIEEIADLVNTGASEGAHNAVYLTMFNNLKQLMYTQEQYCIEHPGPKGIYALMHLYNQMRELIADMRANADLEGQLIMLETRTIEPAFNTILQLIIGFGYHLRSEIEHSLSSDERDPVVALLTMSLSDLGKGIQSEYNNLTSDIKSFFLEKR